MADAFVGHNIVVSLKVPQGRAIQGVVAEVQSQSSTLILHNAVFLDSRHTFPVFKVMGHDIADISFPDPPTTAAAHPQLPKLAEPPAKKLPADPAIVSFSKPVQAIVPPIEPSSIKALSPVPRRLSTREVVQRSNSRAEVPRSVSNNTTGRRGSKDVTHDEDPARLKRPFSGLDVAIGESSDADGFDRPSPLQSRQSSFQPEWEGALQEYELKLTQIETNSKKSLAKARRELDVILQSTRSDNSAPSVTRVSIASPPEKPKPKPKREAKAADKTPVTATFPGNGWRQSPILKEAKPTNGKTQESRGKKKKLKRKKPVKREEPTGWATEDATDIQELGDFDFEGSLAKFDKSTVFEQFRREDSVPPEERLVGHNKATPATRPGTFGGKNLHPSENVLESKPSQLSSNSKPELRRSATVLADVSSESSDDSTQHALRTSSRVSTRLRHRKPTRTPTSGSAAHKERTNTGPSSKLEGSFHSTSKTVQTTSSTSNDNYPRITPSETPDTLAPSNTRMEYAPFFLDDQGRTCPTITPGVMSALEDIASAELNLRPNTVNENAGRNLAEVIINELVSRNEKLPERDLDSKPLTAIFLVGNHRVGARALVASRHLRDRGVNSVCCVLGLDRPGHQLDPEVNRQLSTIRTPDGVAASKQETVVANWREVQKYLIQTEDQGEFTDVWIDALLAPGHSFDTLVPEEQVAVKEMVAWANTCPPALGSRLIFSIDVPCGINASTGDIIPSEDGSIIQLESTCVVCMGAPRVGLLNALRYASETMVDDAGNGRVGPTYSEVLFDLRIYVVDIGINEVWKGYGEQLGLASATGVDFGLRWTLSLLFSQEADQDDDEDDGEREDDG